MGKDEIKIKIGEVVKSLQSKFPNISVSKIRYFEDQGLLTPERDSSGYRRYGENDIERLSWILKTQRDEYLPLEIIAGKLKAGDFKPETNQRKKLFIEVNHQKNELNEKDILRIGGISSRQLSTLKEHGLLNKTSVYTDDDLDVIMAVRTLLVNGIESRHLKSFKRSAEQEADLTMQVVAPQLKKIEGKEAYEKLDELVKAGKNLRQALLKRELRQSLNGTV